MVGVYARYKKADETFRTWLQDASGCYLPRGGPVEAIYNAALKVVDKGIQMPPDVWAELGKNISLRSQYHQFYCGKGKADEGHLHKINVLRSARQVLRAPPSEARAVGRSVEATRTKDGGTAREKPMTSNMFQNLRIDGESSEESAEEDAKRDVQPVRHLRLLQRVQPASSAESFGGERSIERQSFGESEVLYAQSAVEVEQDVGPQTAELCCLQVVSPDDSPDNKSIGVSFDEVMGEDMFLQAAGLLLDLQAVIEEVNCAWSDYRYGRCDLETATALTNVCLRHAERLTVQIELEWPALDTLAHIITAAKLMPEVLSIRRQVKCSTDVALAVVSDAVFGDPKSQRYWDGLNDNWLVVQGFVISQMLMDMMKTNPTWVPRQTAPLSYAEEYIASAATLMCNRLRRQSGWIPSQARARELVCEMAEATRRFGPSDHIVGLGDPLDPTDPLFGKDGLCYTADFMRTLNQGGYFKRRKDAGYMVPEEGVFGPEWSEDTCPATSTAKLNQYTASSVGALIQLVQSEADTLRKSTHLDALMPLWPLLEEATRLNKITVSMVVAFHIVNLSLVRVNGDRRCKHMHVMNLVAVKKLLRVMSETDNAFSGVPQKGMPAILDRLFSIEPLLEKESGLVVVYKRWFASGRFCSNPQCKDIKCSNVIPERAQAAEKIGRQLQNIVALNPYVAGQRQLMVNLSWGMEHCLALVDCANQMSFALHIYNAMRAVGVIERLELLEVLMKSVGNNPAVWYAGVPSHNFVKNWAHRLGVPSYQKRPGKKGTAHSVSSEIGAAALLADRFVPSLKAEDISPAYRITVKQDLRGTLDGDDGDPFHAELDCVRAAFAEDVVRKWNLAALGAKLLQLPERLVEAIGSQADIEERVAVMHRWGAYWNYLANTILNWCERKLADKRAPYQLPPGLAGKLPGTHPWVSTALGMGGREGTADRSALPPLFPEEEEELALAAKAMASFIKGVKE